MTSSDVVPLRLVNAPGTPPEAHGNYRGRPGDPLAVATFSNLPVVPEGRAYRAWGMFGGRWHLLGTVRPDGRGAALLVVEGPHLRTRPSTLEVTLESSGPRATPTGIPVLSWPGR